MTTASSRRRRLLSIFLVSLGLATTMVQVAGQVTVVTNAAYTRFGTKLYAVGGGFTREVPRKYGRLSGGETTVGDGQFIVLDLSVPWDGANPPWKKLANGPTQYNLPAAFNNDGTKLVAFHASSTANGAFGMIYDVAAGTWHNSTAPVPKPDREGIPGVTDPGENVMYLATGYDIDDKGDQMYRYNFTDDTMAKFPMIGAPMVGMRYFAGAWNAKTKSIMYFGGNGPSGDNVRTGIVTYTPSTNTWSTLVTTGDGPIPRTEMCLVVSDDGSKLIVHGGRATTRPFDQWLLKDINILDLTTNVWTQGRSYTTARMNPVCAFINDTFISWGGSDESQTVGKQAILYDVKRNKYLSKYMGADPDNDYDPLIGPQQDKPSSGAGSSGSGPDWGSGSSSGTGGMIGGIVAAVVVLGGLGLYIRYKMVNRHQDQRQQVISMLEEQRNNTSKPSHGSRPGPARPTGGSTDARPASQQPLPVQPSAPPHFSPNRVSATPVSTVTMVEASRTGGYQPYQYTAHSQPTQVSLPYSQMGLSSPHQSPFAPPQSPLPYPQMGGSPPFQQHPQAPPSPIPMLSMQKQEDSSFGTPPQYEAYTRAERARGPEHIPDFPNS